MIERKALRKFLIPLTAVVFLSVLAACGTRFIPEQAAAESTAPYLQLDATRFEKLPGWKGDDQSEVLGAFLGSCEKLQSLPPESSLGS